MYSRKEVQPRLFSIVYSDTHLNLASICTDYSDDDRGGMAAAPIDGDCGFEAMETHFEGIFQAGGYQAERGGAWGSTDLYQGVEPMG
jgi:hypothetical protein